MYKPEGYGRRAGGSGIRNTKGVFTMMKHEFIEATGYTPDDEEYKYIELSYYESNLSRIEFCEFWVHRGRAAWEVEYEFRQRMDDALAKQRLEYEVKLLEKEEALEFYRDEYDKGLQAQKKLRIIQAALS